MTAYSENQFWFSSEDELFITKLGEAQDDNSQNWTLFLRCTDSKVRPLYIPGRVSMADFGLLMRDYDYRLSTNLVNAVRLIDCPKSLGSMLTWCRDTSEVYYSSWSISMTARQIYTWDRNTYVYFCFSKPEQAVHFKLEHL